VVLGLISLGGLDRISDHHQVVAYGYDVAPDGTQHVYVYDNNSPGREVTLSSGPDNPHFNATNGKIWRGFFLQDYSPMRPPMEHFQRFHLQREAPLPLGEDYTFAPIDWNRDGSQDLFAVRRRHAEGTQAEVHVLSGVAGFQQRLLHVRLPLPQGEDIDYALGDWNRDKRPDLVAVHKRNTPSGRAKVHVLSGASGFEQFLLERDTPLPAGDDFTFTTADWQGQGSTDLVAVRRRNTGSDHAEIHVLSGASSFQQTLLHKRLPVPAGEDYCYAIADWDRDGKPDLVVIRQRRPPAGNTEVTIFSGASEFQQPVLRTTTALPESTEGFEFAAAHWDGDRRPDLIAIDKRLVGSGRLAVHILASGEVEPLV
jgi:hypothetical protein